MTRPDPLQKAQHLVDTSQVREVREALVFDVGRYQVTLRTGGARCTCAATVTCKHIHAAAIAHLSEHPDPSREAMCRAAGQPYSPPHQLTDEERAAGEAAFNAL